MSLAAVTASNAAPTRTHGSAHETTGRGDDSKFAALLSAFDKETAQVEAPAQGSASEGTTAASAATIGKTAKTTHAAVLDAALAGLVRDALAGGANAASKTTTGDGATASTAKSRSTAKSDPRAAAAASPDATQAVAADAATDVTSAKRESARSENADVSTVAAKSRTDDDKTDSAAATNSGVAAATALVASALVAPAGAPIASAVPAATTNGAAVAAAALNAVAAGGAPTPAAASTAAGGGSGASTLRDIVGDDSSLFVSAVASRTYLGLDVASSAARQATSGSSASTSGEAQPTAKRAGATAAAAQTRGVAQARGVATAAATTGESVSAVAEKSSSAKPGDASNPGDSSGSGAASAGSAASASATSSAVDVAGGFSASVSLDQLPNVIADAAEELSAAAQGASGSAAAGASNAQPVKELQINLSPAELGSLQVTMRLTDGKLSVVVEVAKTSTLQAIAGDRDAIASRLGLASASPESLVVQPMRAAATAGADSNGDAQPGTQDNASNGANRDSPAGGQSTSRRDNSADAWRRQGAAARRSSGDLTV